MRASTSFFAIACCSALATAQSACKDAGTSSAPEPTAEGTSASPDAAATPSIEPQPTEVPAPSALAAIADASPNTGDASETSAFRDPFLWAAPLKAKSIGHTSYVLKIHLAGGAVAAYKPRSTLPLGDHRYRGEIAAYRLAFALGLGNVPRAEPRTFRASALRAAFETPQGAADFDRKAMPDSAGALPGAIIPWIDDYEVVALEEPEWRAKWTAWLSARTPDIPQKEVPLAASISTMIAFDYITANWDRWSGANVARRGSDGPLLFVDNDGAFYEEPAPGPLSRQLAELKTVLRFSRSFVHALRAIKNEDLGTVFGDETPGQPLLTAATVEGVRRRISTVLAVIDVRVAHAGEAATLPFD